jgi:p-aminobenzoyl-glutamate transporter AbgT
MSEEPGFKPLSRTGAITLLLAVVACVAYFVVGQVVESRRLTAAKQEEEARQRDRILTRYRMTAEQYAGLDRATVTAIDPGESPASRSASPPAR